MDEKVRLRLVFEDRHILSKPQNSERLKRSWILLQPQHQTISDLASHLLRTFELQNTCSNGLVLSMDGFVLPPFESTCILKDKDVVRIKKKGGALTNVIEVGDAVNSLEEVEIVQKQAVVTGVKLLADEEFKETRGCGSEPEEDECDRPEDVLGVENTPAGNTLSRKRKASKKLRSSKRKGNKYATAEECPFVSEDVENEMMLSKIDAEIDIPGEQNKSSYQHDVPPQKSLAKKEKSSNLQGGPDESSTLEISEMNERSNCSSKSTPNAETFCQLQENGKGSANVSNTSDGTKKYPSRNTRRKKAKRQWLREQAKMQMKELHQGQLLKNDMQQLPENVNKKFSEECQQRHSLERDNHQLSDYVSKKLTEVCQQSDQSSDVDVELFPVEDRPGHIRFEPLGKDQSLQKNQVPLETYQWNGITSKKKGQKWGKEKIPSCKRNDYRTFNGVCSEMLTIEEETPANGPIDFNKLIPSTDLPKEGDLLAYRLIELSSSWTPELSSFRVGKVSQYYPESNGIVLVPVPEYPIVIEKKTDEEEASAPEPDSSLYGEDGSLKVDFSSLFDVRTVEHVNLDSAKVTSAVKEDPVGDQITVTGSWPYNYIEETLAPTRENGLVTVWEEISQALSIKKAELSQEDDWTKKGSSSGNCLS